MRVRFQKRRHVARKDASGMFNQSQHQLSPPRIGSVADGILSDRTSVDVGPFRRRLRVIVGHPVHLDEKEVARMQTFRDSGLHPRAVWTLERHKLPRAHAMRHGDLHRNRPLPDAER